MRTEPDAELLLSLLSGGEMEVLGLLPYASNVTLLSRVRNGRSEQLAVYKPRRGEAPLWDFPGGTLCLREQAAWVVDRALGWSIVPPTVLRPGPAGFGAVQLFVEHAPDPDESDLLETHPDDLRRVALFDLVANNADRKAGHLLVDADGRLRGVDHGLCFHADPKLRTVIWAFQGEAVPASLLADLERLRAGLHEDDLHEALDGLLTDVEHRALADRVDALLARRRFPAPGPGRHVPWPPW